MWIDCLTVDSHEMPGLTIVVYTRRRFTWNAKTNFLWIIKQNQNVVWRSVFCALWINKTLSLYSYKYWKTKNYAIKSKCSENCLKWFESYLTNRTQRVSLNNNVSEPEHVTCGVPQGSVLGPLLFLLFINDLPLVLKNSAKVDLYADGTTIYDVQCNTDQLESNLQISLNALHVWCRQNGMVLNTEKTNVMLITSRQRRSNLQNPNLSLRYNEIDIKMTTISKILGVKNENLLWNNQLLHVSKNVSSYLWLLGKMRQYLSKEHRLLFYNALH